MILKYMILTKHLERLEASEVYKVESVTRGKSMTQDDSVFHVTLITWGKA